MLWEGFAGRGRAHPRCIMGEWQEQRNEDKYLDYGNRERESTPLHACFLSFLMWPLDLTGSLEAVQSHDACMALNQARQPVPAKVVGLRGERRRTSHCRSRRFNSLVHVPLLVARRHHGCTTHLAGLIVREDREAHPLKLIVGPFFSRRSSFVAALQESP